MDLGHISLRQRERALLAGGVDSGKSTLEEALVADFYARYDNSRILLVDSKPRFRAQYEVGGAPATRRYRNWDHGPLVPGSVVVTRPEDMDLAWSTGARIVIAQAQGSKMFPAIVACAERFYDEARASRPQLTAVDETMDLFRQNGTPIGGDALIRTARSGREIGLAGLYCSQRTKGIPGQLLDYLEKLYLFRVDAIEDVKRTWEMGAPRDLAAPAKKRQFNYWTKADYHTVYGPYTLQLGRRPPPAGVTPVELPNAPHLRARRPAPPPAPTPAGPASAWSQRRR